MICLHALHKKGKAYKLVWLFYKTYRVIETVDNGVIETVDNCVMVTPVNHLQETPIHVAMD